jgi:hypothetical protein
MDPFSIQQYCCMVTAVLSEEEKTMKFFSSSKKCLRQINKLLELQKPPKVVSIGQGWI